MVTGAAIHTRLERALASRSPEALLTAIVLAFVVAAAVALRLVPIHDYVEDVNGAIITDVRPTRLLSEDQYLIAKVYKRLGDSVRRGDALVQLDGAKQRVEMVKLEQSMDAKRSELAYNREKQESIDLKLGLNSQVIEKKRRLASMDARNTKMIVALDAKRTGVARELRLLSEDIVHRIVPALDSPAISKIEKAKVLSDANSNLQRMYEFAAETQSNQHKAERDQLLLQVEVAELEVEQANLRLTKAEVSRSINVLQGEIESIMQEHAELDDALDRLLIRAPIDGQIIRVSPSLLDSNLVEQNDELFLIQPAGASLEAELALTDEQFKDARVGQEVNLELYAWNHYKYGSIRGEITSISSSKIMPQIYQSKSPQFIANVRILPEQNLQLQAGYDLEATIILGKISLFDFILKKIQVK
jgi:multidrug resistance efflux pump